MSRRDKLVIAGVIALFVVGFGWIEVVSPERAKVPKLTSSIETARQSLQNAQSELSTAQSAQARYAEAYSAMVRLGKAVPVQQEVPGLIYELDQASDQRHVEFASIGVAGAGSGSSTSSAASAKAAASAAPTFSQMPFTFSFNGSFANLYHLVSTLQGLDAYSPSGALNVSGRLLTIQSVDLTPETQGAGTSSGAGSPAGAPSGTPGEHLAGTITATAYVLPASQGLTGGATESGPGGGSASSGTASGSGSTSTAPATIKAAP
ncbi:MAG: hypothetical protein ACYDA6_02650 [Solirubrobacteraceae bacterium]